MPFGNAGASLRPDLIDEPRRRGKSLHRFRRRCDSDRNGGRGECDPFHRPRRRCVKKDVRRRLPLFRPFRLVGFVYGMHHRNAACEIRPSFHRWPYAVYIENGIEYTVYGEYDVRYDLSILDIAKAFSEDPACAEDMKKILDDYENTTAI